MNHISDLIKLSSLVISFPSFKKGSQTEVCDPCCCRYWWHETHCENQRPYCAGWVIVFI